MERSEWLGGEVVRQVEKERLEVWVMLKVEEEMGAEKRQVERERWCHNHVVSERKKK